MRKFIKMLFGYQNGRRTKPIFWQPKKRSTYVVSFTPVSRLVSIDERAGKANEIKQPNIDQTGNTAFGRIVAFFRSLFSLLRSRLFRFRSSYYSPYFKNGLISSKKLSRLTIFWRT